MFRRPNFPGVYLMVRLEEVWRERIDSLQYGLILQRTAESPTRLPNGQACRPSSRLRRGLFASTPPPARPAALSRQPQSECTAQIEAPQWSTSLPAEKGEGIQRTLAQSPKRAAKQVVRWQITSIEPAKPAFRPRPRKRRREHASQGAMHLILRRSSGFMPKSAGTRINRTPPKGHCCTPGHTEHAVFG